MASTHAQCLRQQWLPACTYCVCIACGAVELQQAAAAEYRARNELTLSRSSLRATQHALHKEAAIIQSLEQQLVAERTAAAVRAASVRIRAAMQARKAASAQAQQLAAQNACLLADRKSLMQRLAGLEQQRDGMLG